MTYRSATRNVATLIAVASLALLAAAPSATAQSDVLANLAQALCQPEPLGPSGGGAVGQAKAAGNTIIFTGCTLVLGVLSPVLVIVDAGVQLAFQLADGAITLVGNAVDAVCIFVFGTPCSIITPPADE